MRYLLYFFILSGCPLFGQSSRPNKATSLNPGSVKEEVHAPAKSKASTRKGSHVESQDEYVARMKRTVKLMRKQERLMKKPQYSDPMYFGHKRPPKKHKAGKLKFCKECGIRH